MGKSKRYYWLKLKEDFFDDETIEWIEDQENGKEYCLFYLKLCLKSLKSNGVLVRSVGDIFVPYDAKKLAEITRTDHDTVVIAMQLLQKTGLVQILDGGEIYLSRLAEMVGSETDKAALMRRARAQKALSNAVVTMLPECYTEYRDIENRDIENRDIENRDIENRDKDNRDIEKEREEKKKREEEKKKEKITRRKYGEYANVLLSDEEYEKLKKDYPNEYEDYIERLSEYIGKSGKKYQSHYITIRSWIRKDKKEQQAQQQTRPADYDKLPKGELPF